MPDIRYHFIYLIAVFVMLGVGMLVGASFVGPDQVKRQTTYIRDLREQANRAVLESQASQDQLTKTGTALDDLRPGLVRGKLTGRRVTLIQTGDYADATQAAATALRDAGASPVVTLVLNAKWEVLQDAARATAMSELVQALSTGTSTDSSAQALQTLEDQGLVTMAGDLDAPCTQFVLVGGAKDDDGPTTEGTIDGVLITALQTASPKAVIVGCEPFTAAVSFMPTYQSAHIATVDCIDRSLGQLDLPFALRGGQDTDDYGLKPTARRQIPASLEAQSGP
jgi:hypothetical protein